MFTRQLQKFFASLFNYEQHFRSFHICNETLNDIASDLSPIAEHIDNVYLREVGTNEQPIHSAASRDCLEVIQSEGCTMVASLCASCSVSYSVIPKIVYSCENLIVSIQKQSEL